MSLYLSKDNSFIISIISIINIISIISIISIIIKMDPIEDKLTL